MAKKRNVIPSSEEDLRHLQEQYDKDANRSGGSSLMPPFMAGRSSKVDQSKKKPKGKDAGTSDEVDQ